ncbi:MAG: hypothetical protein R3291_01030 [Thermoplasmata archaeon]|nr:hypothetical protein [Thermoplasmata archaeon]
MPASNVLPWVALRWGRPRDPAEKTKGPGDLHMLRAAGKEHGRVLVWDLEAMAGGDPQLEVYRRHEGKGLWVDSAARNLGTLVDVLVAGAEVAVINASRMRRPDVLAEANQLTGQLAYCVEQGPAAPTQDDPSDPLGLFQEALEVGIERGVYLRYPQLHDVPTWVEKLEEMELYVGPVPVVAGVPQVEGRVIANLYEMI